MTDSQVEAQVENNAEGVQKLTDTKAVSYTHLDVYKRQFL